MVDVSWDPLPSVLELTSRSNPFAPEMQTPKQSITTTDGSAGTTPGAMSSSLTKMASLLTSPSKRFDPDRPTRSTTTCGLSYALIACGPRPLAYSLQPTASSLQPPASSLQPPAYGQARSTCTRTCTPCTTRTRARGARGRGGGYF